MLPSIGSVRYCSSFNQPSPSNSCRIGFEKDQRTGECVDVDECETGEAACDAQLQVCMNVEGSYKCLDIQEVKCEAGFRYDRKTGKCEGGLQN